MATGKTGFLFKTGDARDLTNKVREISGFRMDIEFLTEFLKKFSPERITDEYIDVYRSALRKKG